MFHMSKSKKVAGPQKSKKPAASAKAPVKAAAAVAAVAAKKVPVAQAGTAAEISARAHVIWADAGKPEGKSLEHWLQAERELCGK